MSYATFELCLTFGSSLESISYINGTIDGCGYQLIHPTGYKHLGPYLNVKVWYKRGVARHTENMVARQCIFFSSYCPHSWCSKLITSVSEHGRLAGEGLKSTVHII